jgi:DNA-binding MarR family transcriptional regulator
MTGAARDEERPRFIEDMALLYEKAGHTRMQGRIIAWLMLAETPHQTAGEIAAGLQASKASISTNIRMFVDFGVIERFTRPPERRDYYRLSGDAWARAVERGFPLIAAFHGLAERGLELVCDRGDARARLEDMRDFYEFYERELRAALARWECRK